jgi:hypothetical protein
VPSIICTSGIRYSAAILIIWTILPDRGIRGAAAHGEVVGEDHRRAPVQRRPPGDGTGRQEALHLVIGRIGGAPGNLADLMEAARVCQKGDALAHGQLAAAALALDGFVAAHFLGQPFAPAELFNRFFPTHGLSFHASPALGQADVRPVRQEFAHAPVRQTETPRFVTLGRAAFP